MDASSSDFFSMGKDIYVELWNGIGNTNLMWEKNTKKVFKEKLLENIEYISWINVMRF